MSAGQALVIVALGSFIVVSAVGFFNVWLARRKMSEWKRCSACHFLLTIMTGPQTRRIDSASLWMERFGYREADAFRLADYQWIAGLESLFFVFAWFLIALKLFTR